MVAYGIRNSITVYFFGRRIYVLIRIRHIDLALYISGIDFHHEQKQTHGSTIDGYIDKQN
jgi:hypothetical protein